MEQDLRPSQNSSSCLIRLPRSQPRPVPAPNLGQTRERGSWGRNSATQGMLRLEARQQEASRITRRHSKPARGPGDVCGSCLPVWDSGR